MTARTCAAVALALATAACGLQPSGIEGMAARGAATGQAVDSPAGPAAGGGVAAETRQGLAAGGPAGSGSTDPVVGGAGSAEDRVIGGGGLADSDAPAAGRPPVQDSPGLRGEIALSFVNVTGWDQLAKLVVVSTASTGDAQEQVAALTSYVNSHGGIAGRKMVAHVHDYNAQQASEVNDNNLCREITSVDKAFMVNLQGQIHFSARDCYAAKGTLAFEGATFGWGRSFYDAHAPYLWSPSYADYDSTVRALVASARERRWLAGQKKVGVVLWDDEPYHDVVDRTLLPALKAAGVETVVKAAVSNADIGSIENGIHAAAQTMTANGVTHLMFAGSAPLQPFFVQQNQQAPFVYALTSFDIPRYMAVNFPRNMAGAIGIGFSPVNDVLDAQYPFPQPGLEAQCRAMYEAAGVSIPGRYVNDRFDSKQAMSYCESTLLLKRVADTMPADLSPQRWAAGAERLGRSFPMSQTFLTSFGPNKHTGASSYRDLAFDPGCGCIVYTSGTRSF